MRAAINKGKFPTLILTFTQFLSFLIDYKFLNLHNGTKENLSRNPSLHRKNVIIYGVEKSTTTFSKQCCELNVNDHLE